MLPLLHRAFTCSNTIATSLQGGCASSGLLKLILGHLAAIVAQSRRTGFEDLQDIVLCDGSHVPLCVGRPCNVLETEIQ